MSVEWRGLMTEGQIKGEREKIEELAYEFYGWSPVPTDNAQWMLGLLCGLLKDVVYELTTLHGLYAIDGLDFPKDAPWQIDTSELRARIDGILADVAKVEKEAW